MATVLNQLIALFRSVDRFDLDASRVDWLCDLGSKLMGCTGARSVEFAIIDDPEAGAALAPSADVTVIRLPELQVDLAGRDESWWRGYLQPGEARPSPAVDRVPGADTEYGAVIVPLRTTLCWGAIRVSGGESILRETETWATALTALTEMFGMRQELVRRQQRQTFYRNLVDFAGYDPNETSPLVCSLWHRLSRADWVWLWLYNEYTDRYELAAYAGSPPPADFEPGPDSASAYAVDTGQVVVARGDLAAWRRQYQSREYQMVYGGLSEQEGCNCVVCVPLLNAPIEAAEDRTAHKLPRVRGAVSFHYCDIHGGPQQPKESLLLMGRHCAQSISNAFLEEQRRILVSLTQMAQRHLTRVSRWPVQVRKEYLNDLIELIQHSLHFRAVSIFYRRPFDEAIECIATTGLAWPAGQPISQNRLSDVVYPTGVGRTGCCFRDGKLLTRPKENDLSHEPITRDIDPKTGEFVRGLVFQPIFAHDGGGKNLQGIGVIRCGAYELAGDDLGGRITFHPVHIQTLGFIAQQVGPMLQIFENNMRRERTISTVKHDLLTNNNMIRDASERIARDWEHDQKIRDYDVKNLGVSHLMGTHLIAQLDAEPGSKEAYAPEPTFIVGDILARVVNMLRHYAWSYRRMRIEFDEGIIDTIPCLRVDRSLIERVIHNVLVNAVKYGQPQSTISISARSTLDGGLGRWNGVTNDKWSGRQGYLLDIENFGLGIDDKDADLIGKPNYRSEKAKALAQGIGLGVYIAQKAMERHGGKLILLRPRDPTIFTMFFPRNLAT